MMFAVSRRANPVLTSTQHCVRAELFPAAGEFVITHPNVQVPTRGPIYSINEGNAINWDVATKR